MSVNYPVNVLNGRLTVVNNDLDAGSSGARLRLLDSGGNTLSTITLLNPAGTIASGVLSFNGLSLIDAGAAGTGTAVGARIEDSNGTLVISGLTVGPPGQANDIVMSPTNAIVAGQVVVLAQATITGN